MTLEAWRAELERLEAEAAAALEAEKKTHRALAEAQSAVRVAEMARDDAGREDRQARRRSAAAGEALGRHRRARADVAPALTEARKP